jgi:hypothetical protein
MVKSAKVSKESAQYMVGVEKLPLLERSWNLDAALATFDPKRHGGEAMADAPVGFEKLFDTRGAAGRLANARQAGRRRRP